MKHLKVYEEFEKDVVYGDIRQGDYVIVNCADHDIKNEVMKVVSVEIMNRSEGGMLNFTFTAHKIGVNKYDGNLTFYDYEIVKKIRPDEVDLYLDTKKYNV